MEERKDKGNTIEFGDTVRRGSDLFHPRGAMQNAIDSTGSLTESAEIFQRKEGGRRDPPSGRINDCCTLAQPKPRKGEIACSFYDPSIEFSVLFEKMESFVGPGRVVLGNATRKGKHRLKLLWSRRWRGGGEANGPVKERRNIHRCAASCVDCSGVGGSGGGGRRERKVVASKSGSKM